MGHINVTPLIDVVMCLIIFFLLVGRLALERKGFVELPTTLIGEEEVIVERPIIVAVQADGVVLVDGAPTDADRLAAEIGAIRGAEPDRPVQIRADRTAVYALVRPVVSACRDLGVRDVAMVASAGSGAERVEPGVWRRAE